MIYNPEIHHRRSIRLKGFDYSQSGAYFVTVCTHNRDCLFGEIENENMVLNDLGRIVDNEWKKIAINRNRVGLDKYVVMPNHFHGIIIICRDTARRVPTMEQFGKPVSGSLPTIVRSFKSAVTNKINQMRNTPGMHV